MENWTIKNTLLKYSFHSFLSIGKLNKSKLITNILISHNKIFINYFLPSYLENYNNLKDEY